MFCFVPNLSSRATKRGFTIVEIMVTVTVAAILVSIGVESTLGYQSQARDSERISDVEIISQSIERHYRSQAVVTGASYPATTVSASGLVAIVGDDEGVTAPGKTNPSLAIASSGSAQTPSLDTYVYQPLNLDGSLCTAAPCVRYIIYYRLEKNNDIIARNSLRQQ